MYAITSSKYTEQTPPPPPTPTPTPTPQWSPLVQATLQWNCNQKQIACKKKKMKLIYWENVSLVSNTIYDKILNELIGGLDFLMHKIYFSILSPNQSGQQTAPLPRSCAVVIALS